MSFSTTQNPTPFGFFDSDSDFQTEADAMITFVKRKLGDDVLSVELTSKQIWACFEEAFCEYGAIVNQYQAKSQLSNLFGAATGSLDGSEQKYPRQTLEFALRLAEPYISNAGLGGMYNDYSGSIQLRRAVQDYDIYSELVDSNGTPIVETVGENPGKMKIFEVMHFSPIGAYRFFDTTSAINYLNNEFSFESFTPETVFYVLPVFEDILRGGQMKISNKVRRSNYSYMIVGRKIRISPMPTDDTPPKLWFRVGFAQNALNPDVADDSINGVSNLSNVPFGNFIYSRINSIGRQWTRQYTIALCKELLGLVRSKFDSIPIPGSDLRLNGQTLLDQGKSEKESLITQLKEMLDTLTYDKLLEAEAAKVDNVRKILAAIPIPIGRSITIG